MRRRPLPGNSRPSTPRAKSAVETLQRTLLVIFLAFPGAIALAHDDRDDSPLPDRVTYAEGVAGILNRHCVSCHRKGQMAPMSLATYEEVRPWAKTIRQQVMAGTMPPWHADPRYGEFVNDRSLSPREIALIDRWVRQGSPLGDAARIPPRPEFPTSWSLGEPDYVTELEEVTVAAEGADLFPALEVPLDFATDRWIRAIEIRPAEPRVVHHAIVYVLAAGETAPTSGWLGGWAAGLDTMVFPEGTGRFVPRGSRLVADMHYHPMGERVRERTQIGLYFHDEPPPKELVNLWVQNAGFQIPPEAPDHEVRATYIFPQDSLIYALLPHMHYRGKDFTYTVRYPDGREEILLKVNEYDFNWQTAYQLAEPRLLPRGSRIECVAHFDNSRANPHNPDPTRLVPYGKEASDEMMIGFVDYVVREGRHPLSPEAQVAAALAELVAEHPGEVYAVELQLGLATLHTALYFPARGVGRWFLPIRSQVHDARVFAIEHDGTSFSGQIETNFGRFSFDGAFLDGHRRLEGTLHMGNAELSYHGAPARKSAPEDGR